MSDGEKLVNSFAVALQIDPSEVVDDLAYSSSRWDSVAHMTLVASLEQAFDILLETDDILDISSVRKAKEILSKHGCQFDS